MSPMSDLFKNIVTILSNGLNFIKLETIVPNVLFSILAALIFWIIFHYFPEKQRKTKLRPKVEFDLPATDNRETRRHGKGSICIRVFRFA